MARTASRCCERRGDLVRVIGRGKFLLGIRHGDAERLVCPLSQIYHLAAFAAKRAIGILAIPGGGFAAVRAGDEEG